MFPGQVTMTELFSYWPQLQHVQECLRTEAETIDEALLLAVHEPVGLLRRSDQNAKDIVSTEQDLLKELMRPAGDGSAVIVAITGASGVGKSHMVRWLRAQLERHRRRSELVIVTIPKTASLRRVVELILAPLPGDAYQALREELDRTVEALEPVKAAGLLGTALAMELHTYEQRLQDDLRSGRVGRELGPRATLARHLHKIVRDPDVLDAWFSEVLLRIINASLGGSGDPLSRQFNPEDLAPPSIALRAIQSKDVHAGLQFLANAGGKNRDTAAEILQEVLDPALRTIFGLTQATQRRTVQELVDDIRQQLLLDNKELVLLIEDLAALSGIQQPLLDIMIAETDEAGRKVRAQIRTAVAVTDGFLAGRQTVLTRARGQWIVQSEGLDEEAVVRRLVEITGRYLNASRFGVSRLKEAFKESGTSGSDLYAWVPKFEECDVTPSQVEAFGKSVAGYSLFPFNEYAVRSLAAHVLKSSSGWSFNPRSFINEVLRKVLLELVAFQEGQFPPPNFFAPRVSSQIALDLQNQGYSSLELGRLEAALFHWAGNPSRLQSPSIPKEVFHVFGLPWPFSANQVPPLGKATGSGVDYEKKRSEPLVNQPTLSTQLQPISQPLAEALAESPFSLAVEDWDGSSRLMQTHAARARLLLHSALDRRMAFTELAMPGFRIDSKHFWLPPENTVSNPNGEQFRVKVAEEGEHVPPYVKAGLKALDRWDIQGKRWDFPQAEEDYAHASVLLDALERQLVPCALEEVERETAILMAALHRQALVAGIKGAAAPEDEPIRLIFSNKPATPAIIDSDLTASVRAAVLERDKALEARSELQDRLVDNIACFQGDRGRKVFAIDHDRLRKAWKRELPPRWTLASKSRDPAAPKMVDALDRLASLLQGAVLQKISGAAEEIRSQVVDAFSTDHARVAWREEMTGCVERSSQLGLWPTAVIQAEVRKAIEQLSSEEADSWIRRALRMPPHDATNSPLERLAALSHVPLPQLVFLQQAISKVETYLDTQQRLIQHQSKVDDDDALRVRQELLDQLRWDV